MGLLIFFITEYTEFHGVLLLSSRTERSVVKDLGNINVDALDFLPPFGRLDDKYRNRKTLCASVYSVVNKLDSDGNR